MENKSQNEINEQNSKFWTEPCGSTAAAAIGTIDHSKEELEKYDLYFFELYPYLKGYVNLQKDENFLEVGLGYGSLSQYLMHKSKKGLFLDIAEGPVNLAKTRASYSEKGNYEFRVGSILETQNSMNYQFDQIYAIGCLHHTGNFEKAINNCYDLLKDGGTITFMVYNAFSYRQFLKSPIRTTFNYFRYEIFGIGLLNYGEESDNAGYDTNLKGESAPCTQFISVRKIHHICEKFRNIKVEVQNISEKYDRFSGSRSKSLKSFVARFFGTDLYCICKK